MNKFLLSFLGAAVLYASSALAIGRDHSQIDVSKFAGKTFFQLMTDDEGIKAALDQDETEKFTVASVSALHRATDEFEPSVYKKVLNFFSDGEEGFDALIEGLHADGKNISPLTATSAIGSQLENNDLLKDSGKIGLASVTIAPFLGMASGAGTIVKIDDENIFYNYGYKPGSEDPEELAKHVKSGRSFGASGSRKALDPSDVFYLNELEKYLGNKSAEKFYGALLDVLLQCETDSYGSLPADGQIVATDFFAIYTAELDRHLMTGLTKHPWENDLTEVTLLAVFDTETGLVYKDGALVEGPLKEYFAVGKTGSGIGNTRQDRRALQLLITKAEKRLHPEVVEKLQNILGLSSGQDVYRGLLEYLNNFETQDDVVQNSAEIKQAALEFLKQVQADAAEIAADIQ